jgi:hypothetical protein
MKNNIKKLFQIEAAFFMLYNHLVILSFII